MLELIRKGPRIPLHLMNEWDSGRVAFFCGAGISAAPGSDLPDFANLVKHVYEANHMEPDASEREALNLKERSIACWRPDRGQPSFDKALGLLERRIGAKILRQSVIERLSAPRTGPLSIHEALIELSRRERGVRLITTNFDNRFVEAGLDEQDVDAAPKLPVPKPHSWSSLVHLHGRLNDEGANLVLTTADFGRAYLSERWAARFVTELFREFVVVFVGYSVGDPVMSYMVEALAAERAKGARFAMAYAFAGHDGTDPDRQKARWLAKNVEPILYDDQDGHRLFSDTLIEWARIRRDPYQARARIALDAMSKLPAGSNDPVAERVAWALQAPVAAQALADAPPVVDEDEFPKIEAWLEVFAEKGLLHCAAADANPEVVDQDPAFVRSVGHQPLNPETPDMTERHLARWMARHLHVPQLLAWTLRRSDHLHPDLRNEVQMNLSNSEIPSKLRLLWTVLSKHEPADPWRHVWTAERYSAAASESERRQIEDEVVESIAPRLVVFAGPSPQLKWNPSFDKNANLPIDACGHLKLVSGDDDSQDLIEKILQNTAALSRHADTLTGYLDKALTLIADDDDACPYSTLYRPSIAAHDQNQDHDGWTHLIDLARDSYFALAEEAPARGDNLLRRWALSGHPLFERLALHALTENARSDIQLARKLLVAGRKPGVWETELLREALRFFRLAGSRLPRSLRVEIVRAIHAGPKTKPPKTATNYAEELRREKALRFYKLTVSGVRLDRKSRALAEEIASGIEDKSGERDEFWAWFGKPRFVSKTEFAPKELVDGSVDDVVTWIRDGKIGHHGFGGLVLLQPDKAFSALQNLAGSEEWPAEFWRDFLWSLCGLREKPQYNAELQRSVALRLSEAPGKFFSEVDSAAADFVKDLATDYETDQEQEIEELWMKAWSGVGMSTPKTGYPDDPLTGALNHVAGKLAEAALIRLQKYEPKVDGGLPSPIRIYFDTIVNDRDGKFGRVMLTTELYFLFGIDRDWVGKHLIPLLSLRSSEEARDLWSAYSWSATVGPDLLFAFKDSFLEILRDSDDGYRRKNHLTGLFVTICIEAPNLLTEQEIRSVVRAFPENALVTALNRLSRCLEVDPDARKDIWCKTVHPWLGAYWPADRNTPATSRAMLDLLAECGDAFPDAVGWSLDHLQPPNKPDFHQFERNGLAKKHPDSTLQVLDKVVVGDASSPFQRAMLRRLS